MLKKVGFLESHSSTGLLCRMMKSNRWFKSLTAPTICYFTHLISIFTGEDVGKS